MNGWFIRPIKRKQFFAAPIFTEAYTGINFVFMFIKYYLKSWIPSMNTNK